MIRTGKRSVVVIVAAAKETASNGASLQLDGHITRIAAAFVCTKDLGSCTAGHRELDIALDVAFTTAAANQTVSATAGHLRIHIAGNDTGSVADADNAVYITTGNGQIDIAAHIAVTAVVIAAAVQAGHSIVGNGIIRIDSANIQIHIAVYIGLVAAAINAGVAIVTQVTAAQQLHIGSGNSFLKATAIQLEILADNGNIFINLQTEAVGKIVHIICQNQFQIIIGNGITLRIVIECCAAVCTLDIACGQIQLATGDGNILIMIVPYKSGRCGEAVHNVNCTAIFYQLQCLIQAKNRRFHCTGIGVDTGSGYIDICKFVRRSHIDCECAQQQHHSSQNQKNSFCHVDFLLFLI